MVELAKKVEEKKVDPVAVPAQQTATTEVSVKKDLPPSLRKAMNDYLVESEKELKRVLPAHVSSDRFLRICQTEITKNPLLLECSKVSFLGSIFISAQLGLEIGSHLGYAYLIPYKKECSFQIGYKGWLDLVRRPDKITGVNVQNIYDNDFIEMDPINNEIKFSPLYKGDRGKHYMTVAVAHFKDGNKHIDWMSVEQINKRKGVAKTSNVWNEWYERMAEKTVLKSLCRLLPMSIEDMRIINVDERVVTKLVYDKQELLENTESIYDIHPELSNSTAIETKEEVKPTNAVEALFDDKK